MKKEKNTNVVASVGGLLFRCVSNHRSGSNPTNQAKQFGRGKKKIKRQQQQQQKIFKSPFSLAGDWFIHFVCMIFFPSKLLAAAVYLLEQER